MPTNSDLLSPGLFQTTLLGLAQFEERLARALVMDGWELSREGLAYWRRHTPVRTGDLRRAQFARPVLLRQAGGGFTLHLRFGVANPQRVVYRTLLRRHHPRLRGIMERWSARVATPRLRATARREFRRAIHG
ncbi:MAG: hypothetical protein OXI80_12170 [Caldilineaceae bacterium]|nr:hypothetical protein [Caldilineaceae bacterium]